LPASVHAALETHNGQLGQLLKAVSAADSRDLDTASTLLASLGIDCDTFTSAQLTALSWASSIRPNA
jgi:c-di-GMP-related signal transduction protein